MRIFLPIAALAMLACYSPNLSGVRFSCTGDGKPDDCPSGYSCVRSLCLLPGEQPGGSSDGGMNMQPDGGAPDAGGIPPGAAAGCASMTGYDVAKDPGTTLAFACPGAFQGSSSSDAFALCASGYTVCQDASAIDLNKCNAPGIQGFFIGDKRGEHSSTSTAAACGTQGGFSEDYWVGCGSTSGIRLVTLSQPCSGFSLGRDCDNTASSEFNCQGDNERSIDEVTSTNPVHGVLCCK